MLGLSGGVDSTVAAVLLHKAIGNGLVCVFVDTGLLRKSDYDVIQTFQSFFPQIDVRTISAKTAFLCALIGVTDPEQKRKIIGEMFVNIFGMEAKQLKAQAQEENVAEVDWFLAQGTIQSDVVESSSSSSCSSQTIKSHHNVGGLPSDVEEMFTGGLIEPLRNLYKDEVRSLGLRLGISTSFLNRHPFPGPGLAIRILGEVTGKSVGTVRAADEIFLATLEKHGQSKKVSQAFAVLLPTIQTVGVVGDARVYASVIVLRAVHSEDFMTASWAPIPSEILQEASSRIVNEVEGIARVCYDVTNKPPGTIEWE